MTAREFDTHSGKLYAYGQDSYCLHSSAYMYRYRCMHVAIVTCMHVRIDIHLSRIITNFVRYRVAIARTSFKPFSGLIYQQLKA